MVSPIDHRTPDQQLEPQDDDSVVAEILAELGPDIAAQLKRVMVRDEACSMLSFFSRALSYAVHPKMERAKVFGIIYAMDLGLLHGEKPPAATARDWGLTRASISHAMREFATLTGLPPSRWMRSEETVANNRQAREELCR